MFQHQNAFNYLPKQSLSGLCFQIYHKQSLPLANNHIIKSRETICQSWFKLVCGALLISRDVEWRKAHYLFGYYDYWKKCNLSYLIKQKLTPSLGQSK
jgi:hypothetical protein